MGNILEPDMQWEHTPAAIIASLPRHAYEVARQPDFSDQVGLAAALDAVQHIAPVATRESILRTRIRLAGIAVNHKKVLVIQGNCNERVGLHSPRHLADMMLVRREAVSASQVGSRALLIERGLGQNTKPRTKAGGYCGDMVNDPDDLTPDPARIIAAAEQARSVQEELGRSAGRAMSAHEALLVPFERSRLAVDMNTGERFLLSADIPWIGDRTSDPKGVHVALLSGIQNAVGIKVGDATTPARIAAWARKLNPDQEAGKLLFMIRMSDQRADAMRAVIRAITSSAPHSIILYDIHAATEDVGGQKIRSTAKIIAQIHQLAEACSESGAVLDGVHLETDTLASSQLQCVDTPSQRPNHAWSVDPQLNPRQLQQVLNACARCFGLQKVAA